MKTRYTVTVPASTANIGPGFDALGLALSLYAKFTFEEHTENVVTGCPEAFRNDDNLVLQVFRRVYEHVGRVAPKVKLHIDSTVPVERGLGSSSTCIVAGAAAANAMMGRPLSNDELFQICTAIEGHPDNVAPALFGGLAASFMNGDKAIHMPINTDPAWRFVTIIPDFPVKTHEARQILPKSFTMKDVVYTMSHAIGVVRALETGNVELLNEACRDQLHEPYRATLIPSFKALKDMAQAAGATFIISGSGSTMIALTKNPLVEETLMREFEAAYPNYEIMTLKADALGTSVQEDYLPE